MPPQCRPTSLQIETSILEAIHAMAQQEQPNIARSAREFDVPETRLRARWKGRAPSRGGQNKALSDDQELAICHYLDRLDQIGLPARIRTITACANAILQQSKSTSMDADANEKPTVSKMWTRRFLLRHPQYYVRKQKPIAMERKQASTSDIILRHFRLFKETREKYGVLDTDIYNMDETGFRIGVGRAHDVITRSKSGPLTKPDPANRESIPSIECVSASGFSLPPMLILPGKLHLEKWVTTNQIDGNTAFAVSDTGYCNDDIALDWIHHFNIHSNKRRVGRWRMLLFDGFGSHLTRQFIEFCDQAEILPFCFPPHTTHLLQPLDVGVFQPLKWYHTEAIDMAIRTGNSTFNKVEFLANWQQVHDQAFKASTIQSAFQKTGLIPYNPQVVLAQLSQQEQQRTITPPPIEPVTWQTPTTISHITQQAELIQQGLEDILEDADDFLDGVKSFIKGSLAKIHSGHLAEIDLSNTQEAALRQVDRQGASSRVTQQGGMVQASRAREWASTRQAEENTVRRSVEQRTEQVRRRAYKRAAKGAARVAKARLRNKPI
jgi:hypothetical protein